MKIARAFTTAGQDAYEGIRFRTTASEIRNPDGTSVFKLDTLEVPEPWSQVAADVIAQKYFRKAGVPSRTVKVAEEGVPEWLRRSVPAEGAAMAGETSAREVFDRLAGAWTYWGWKGGYFTDESDARAYFDEMRHMLARRWGRRTRRSGSTPAFTGPTASTGRRRATSTWTTHGRAHPLPVRLRASAAARLLHPVGRRRPRERGRHHGPLGPRGAALQVRLGHRHELLFAPRRGGEALGRRRSSGLMGFLKIGDRALEPSSPAARRGGPPRW
jgi:ribonucleoside-diphosphate reductase alpha chain